MEEKLKQLKILAQNKEQENKSFFKKFSGKQKRLLDNLIHQAHDEVFNYTDCLECANCCKNLGPRITDRDVDKMAKALKLKPAAITEQYLKTDEDGDMVFKSMPCPFLMHDNYCMIYESRPKACREYPHTERTNMVQIKNITVRNSFTCPAVFDILELVKKRI
ncbi:YkgJ family cysteine cluster protein [Saccharicrinis sp. FJH54]|uniref:YkgJ family cysteine cluster protein n=1 Tax=Saccharicrinis sp. FJH54 TaxID=3344665 RepID=UPI0035D4BB14